MHSLYFLHAYLPSKYCIQTANNISADLIELILELRKDAREQKNWALSDKIRDRLLELGIKIKDGKDKTTWTM